MGKKVHFEVKESLSDLTAMRKEQNGLRPQKRLDALICLKSERFPTRSELASHLSISVRSLERWLARYSSEGLASMLHDLPRNQGSKIITEEIHQGLSERINDPSSPFLGYWDAQRWVEETYGKQVSYHRIRGYLRQHFGSKVKRPRKSHVNKEPGAIEAFLKTAPLC